jgi:hypothetical protein
MLYQWVTTQSWIFRSFHTSYVWCRMSQTAFLILILLMGQRTPILNSRHTLNLTWNWKASAIIVPSIVVLIWSLRDLQQSGVKIRPASNITPRVEIKLRPLTMHSLQSIKVQSHARVSLIVMGTLISKRIFTITEEGLYSTYTRLLSIRLSEIRHQSS